MKPLASPLVFVVFENLYWCWLKYFFASRLTLGESLNNAYMVGIAINANAKSMILTTRSREITHATTIINK